MTITQYLTRQLYAVLSDISHPIEGTFYLFLIALAVRWIWPRAWNSFLKKVSAPVQVNSKKEGSGKPDE